ncbi:MAG: hypothetical protein ACREA9_02555 [Pyrinomonadaceae bacterium]
MDIKKQIQEAQLSKTIEVFTTTHVNEKGETVPFNRMARDRYPAVGLALKKAAER